MTDRRHLLAALPVAGLPMSLIETGPYRSGGGTMGRDVTAPAKRLPAAERADRELRRRILDNALAAGASLPEEEAALMLGLSCTPVREAMVRLAEEGLVEILPRHGMRVKLISADDMREIYEVLAALEPKAAGLAARRGLSAEELAGLEEAVSAMDRALGAGDLEAWAEGDERFHLDLVAASGNRRLAATVGSFWDQAHRVRMATLRFRPCRHPRTRITGPWSRRSGRATRTRRRRCTGATTRTRR